jgi:hypothetical protein
MRQKAGIGCGRAVPGTVKSPPGWAVAATISVCGVDLAFSPAQSAALARPGRASARAVPTSKVAQVFVFMPLPPYRFAPILRANRIEA